MTTFKALTQWLEENEYYDIIDGVKQRIVVLKENDEHTCYGLPQLDTQYIDGIGVDFKNKQVLLKTSETEQYYFSMPSKKALTKKVNIDNFAVKIDGRDFEFGNIGHSDRTFYLEVIE